MGLVAQDDNGKKTHQNLQGFTLASINGNLKRFYFPIESANLFSKPPNLGF